MRAVIDAFWRALADSFRPRVLLLTLAPLAIGKAPPLTRLSLEDRVHAIERVEQSSAGLSVLAAKTMLCFIWYEHPEVRRSVGVTDGCMVEGAS